MHLSYSADNVFIDLTVFYRQDLLESSDEDSESSNSRSESVKESFELMDESSESTYYDSQESIETSESTDDESFLEEQIPLLMHQLSLVKTKETLNVAPEKWQSVIQRVDNLTCMYDTIQDALLPKSQLSAQEQDDQEVYDQVTVERFQNSPIVKCEVTCKLGSSSIVPVWLGQTIMKEHIISPCLQLIEVAPELRICLQHNKHPAECFSDTQLTQASKGNYRSLKEYISLWEKVFLAEVAQDSVLDAQDKPINLLKNVPLQWPQLKIPDNSVDDYYLPQGPVKLTVPPEIQDFLLYNMKIETGDLICVRYDVKEEQCRAVYHLVVRKVKKNREKNEEVFIEVQMEHIGKHSCQISSRMAKILQNEYKHPTCELQVVNLQESYRYI